MIYTPWTGFTGLWKGRKGLGQGLLITGLGNAPLPIVCTPVGQGLAFHRWTPPLQPTFELMSPLQPMGIILLGWFQSVQHS